ncbi:MAG: hypothetical protein WDA23_11260 [Gemmobacter sp.]
MPPFGIAPEALDAVDMDAPIREDRTVWIGIFVDPVMLREARFHEAVIAAEPVGGELGREVDLTRDDSLKRCFRTVFHDLAMHAAATFEDAKDRRLARIHALERSKITLEEKRQNSTQRHGTFEELFELAFGFLANPSKTWNLGRMSVKN